MNSQLKNVKIGDAISGNVLKLYTLREAKGLYVDLYSLEYDDNQVLGVIMPTVYSPHTFQAVTLEGKSLIKTNRSYSYPDQMPDDQYGDFPYGIWH